MKEVVKAYRVVKDNVSRHIFPEMIEYYKNNGYKIYKIVEQEITDQNEDEVDNATQE